MHARPHSTQLLIVFPVAWVTCISTLRASETRIYSFTAELPAYQFTCFCSGPPYNTRGKVQGTFEVNLDFEAGTGTLLSLDATIVESEGQFGQDDWLPYGTDQLFLGPQPYFDRYRPPHQGVLAPATHRPLGPGSSTGEQWSEFSGQPISKIPRPIYDWLSHGVAYDYASPDSWFLQSDGLVPIGDGRISSIGASYHIYLEGDDAYLSYYLPIIDATPSITAAQATFVTVPEPPAVVLFCYGVACTDSLTFGRLRNRYR